MTLSVCVCKTDLRNEGDGGDTVNATAKLG